MRKGSGASSLPSKMMAYMLAGKPILAAVDEAGDAARCIREAECGWVVQPDNPVELAAGLRAIATADRPVLVRMGNAGAAYGTAHFAKGRGVSSMTDILASALSALSEVPGRKRFQEMRG